MISHKLYYTGQLGRILGASGGHFAAEKLSGVAHSVLCSVHILFRNSFQVVSPTLLDYTGTIETCFFLCRLQLHKFYHRVLFGYILGASGGHFAAEKCCGVGHYVLCGVQVLIQNTFQVVTPTLFDYTLPLKLGYMYYLK